MASTALSLPGCSLSSQKAKVIEKSLDVPWRTDLRGSQPQLIKKKEEEPMYCKDGDEKEKDYNW